MRTLPPWHGVRASCLGACLTFVVGCNGILGIEPPILATDDGGSNDARVPFPDGSDDDAGVLIDGGIIDLEHLRPRWPMPNPAMSVGDHPQMYEVRQDTVLDRVTQLTWQRDGSNSDMAWDEAGAYCANLTLAGGGFRLPSRIELLSLIDLTQEGAAIDPNAFPNTAPVAFWSASHRVGTPAQRWGVAFGFGTNVVFQSDASQQWRVRCVRSPQDEAPLGEYVIENAVVEDSATQLHWEQAGLPTLYQWDAAELYCNSLNTSDEGWRLPTLKELHTLVDETRELPATDAQAFPGVAAGYYWTSSQPHGFPALVWTVGFDRGLDVFRGKTSPAFVRCVH